MPIVDHRSLSEKPWRPNYRIYDITRDGDGTTSSSVSWSLVGVGAGAPLHYHEAEEFIVVQEGSLEFRVGSETHRVGPEHTVVIPARTPHGFTNPGPGTARIIAFFPVKDPFLGTTYLEGEPPEVHRGRSRVQHDSPGGGS